MTKRKRNFRERTATVFVAGALLTGAADPAVGAAAALPPVAAPAAPVAFASVSPSDPLIAARVVRWTEPAPCPSRSLAPVRKRAVKRVRRARPVVRKAVLRRASAHPLHPVRRRAAPPEHCEVMRQSRLGGPGAPELGELTPASLVDAAPPAGEPYVPGGGYGGSGGGSSPETGSGGGPGGFGGGGGGGGGGGVGGGGGSGPGTPAAPEPQTWLLLACGVGLVGWALRRRRALAPA